MAKKIESNEKKASRNVRKARGQTAAVVVDTALADEMALLAASLAADGVDVAAVLAVEAVAVEAEAVAVEAEAVAVEAQPAGILATIAERVAAEYKAKADAFAALPSAKARDISTPANHAAVVAKFGAMPAALADAFAAFTVTREAFERFAATVELHGKNDMRASLASFAGIRPSSSALTKNLEGVASIAAKTQGETFSLDTADWLAFGTNKAQQKRFSSAAKAVLESIGAAKRVGASRLEVSAQHAGVQALVSMAKAQRIIA